jgi:hypothetical protein
VKSPLDVKENDKHAIDFSLRLSRLFLGRGEFRVFEYGSCFLPRTFV